ncbi:MAG: C-type lectin domain-containing protein [Chlorobi bacterium]|nr:C-type lectin domain-containing protein [Chlorobiota bacterium]
MKKAILGGVLLVSVIATAQRVGIGTQTPSAWLHVEVKPGSFFPAFLVSKADSTAPYLVITVDGKVGIGLSSPAEVLDVSGNVQFSGALMPGGTAGSIGQVLVSQGPGLPPQWQNASAFGDDWGSQVAITQSPIIGDGTSANPITFASGTGSGQVWKWDGSQWVLANDSVGDNWGSQVAQTQSPVVGDGTSGNPITFASGTAVGQVWKWNGSQWVLANDSVGDNWGSQVAITQGPIVGDGTASNPITFANGSSVGDIWQWDGSSWQLIDLRGAVGNAGYDSVCSSATANYIQKWTGSELCNSILYDNGTNVGIGTVTPQAKFHIQYPMGIIPSYEAIRVDQQGATNPMFVVIGGKVGIGAGTPLDPLQIANRLTFSSTMGGAIGFSYSPTSGTDLNNMYAAEIKLDGLNGYLGFGVSSSTTSAPGTPKVVITNQGLVGIGTITPAYDLDVNGYIRGWKLVPTYLGPMVIADSKDTLKIQNIKYWKFNNHLYVLVMVNNGNNGVTWIRARELAAKYFDGYLATITSKAEQGFIWDSLLAHNSYQAWIGYTDAKTEGDWQWVTGEIGVTSNNNVFTNWAPGEPNDTLGGEDCAYFDGQNSGKWNDNACTYIHRYFIVEISYHTPGY